MSARKTSEVREAVRGPAIATLRSVDEGGRSRLKGSEREDALRVLLDAGFEYVDLELRRDQGLLIPEGREGRRPQLIASMHFQKPVKSSKVEEALDRACAAGDIGKVAIPCDDAGQAIMLARIGVRRSEAGDRFTIIGMGDQGQLTRVCARRIGSSMAYCSLSGKPAAPGQLDVRSQSSLMRRDSVLLGLLGHPVAHSVSKPMQEAALRRAGLAGIYLNLDLPPEELTREALGTLGKLGFSGLNVTIPHKERVFEMCDGVDSETQAAGAVNTITFKGPMMHGKNTDIIGFTEAIESKKNIDAGTEALIVGGGGAARAVALSLRRAGAHATLAVRSPDKAGPMAKDMGLALERLDRLGRTQRAYDVVVNCTPVGTKGVGGVVPVPSAMFKKGVLYFDLVYNPTVTKTMKVAAARKATVSGGLEMLVRQGAASFRSWTGIDPDLRSMRSAARRSLE